MARPVTRNRSLILDDVSRITGLFGTVQNAYKMLNLHREMSYQIFYRAVRMLPVREEEKELIEQRWSRWKKLFLRPEVPVSTDFILEVDMIDDDPEWL